MTIQDPDHYDFIILGQGLAGSLLAWELLERGAGVLVVDNANPAAASKVAAGLVNPVTGRYLSKSAEVDDCLPAACDHYRRLGERFGRQFYYDIPMWRLFAGEQQRQQWHRRLRNPAFAGYLGEELPAGTHQGVAMPHGGGIQQRTGYLTTEPLLERLREAFIGRGAYRRGQFDHREVELSGSGIRWQGLSAKKLIFCEGWRVMDNPWFSGLPMEPAQGEILTLRIEASLPEAILNGVRWLMPRGEGLYKFGATYQAQPLDEQSGEEGVQWLLEEFARLFPDIESQLVEARAGVRPVSADKQPLLGMHPQHAQLGIFNGFGSKGSMLIPWHAARFADFLLDGKMLPASADISRFDRKGDGQAD